MRRLAGAAAAGSLSRVRTAKDITLQERAWLGCEPEDKLVWF